MFFTKKTPFPPCALPKPPLTIPNVSQVPSLHNLQITENDKASTPFRGRDEELATLEILQKRKQIHNTLRIQTPITVFFTSIPVL